MFDVLDTGGMSVPVNSDERPGDALGRPPLGKVLFERGLLTEEQLQAGLAQHQWSGRPLGEVLVALGFVSEATVAHALATQRGGLVKTEYGFVTGFGEIPDGGSSVGEPPVSPEPPAYAAPVIPLHESPRVEELERELASANAELAQANARIPELEGELRAQELRLATSDELAAIANARIAQLENEVESARVALAAAIPAADEMAAETRAQFDALDRDLQEAHAALGAAAARFEAQERDLAEARAENGRLAAELAAAAESFRAVYARLQYLESVAASPPPPPAAAPQPEPQQVQRRAAFTWQS